MDDTMQSCVEAWNDFADKRGLSKVMTVNKSRQSKLKARIKQVMLYADHFGFRDPVEGWSIALDKIEEAGWMFGENNRGWVVNFDNMIGEKFFTKLMEGGYNHASGAKQQNSRTHANSSQSGLAGLMDFAAKHYASVEREPRNSGIQDNGADQKQGRLFA